MQLREPTSMEWTQRISLSTRQLLSNPSIFFVLILELVLAFLAFTLFFLLDTALLTWLNRDALTPQVLQNPQAMISVLSNPQTIALALLLLAVQGAIMIVIDSYFKAGAYGMIKNAIKDGSTSFKEFVPNTKRFFIPFFAYQLIRALLLVIVSIPFVVGLVSIIGTTPSLIDQGQIALIITGSVIAALGGLIVLFLFLYVAPAIFLDGKGAVPAIKHSIELVKSRFLPSVGIALTLLLILVIASILGSLVSLPFNILITPESSQALFLAGDIVKFLTNLISIAAGIIATFFLFHSYMVLSPQKKRVKVRSH